jgi:hypothetical protein
MRVDIDKLEALERAATPGPWFVEPTKYTEPDGRQDICHETEERAVYDWPAEGLEPGDAHFLAEARNAFPELVREVRELRGIAEADRMDHEHARKRKHCACVDFTTGDSVTCEMAEALALYDAGGKTSKEGKKPEGIRRCTNDYRADGLARRPRS